MSTDPRYTVCIASHIFNFLAERTLETFRQKATVIHVGKAFQIERYFKQDWVKDSWTTGNTPLAVSIDALIQHASRQSEPFLVILDHDVSWQKDPAEIISGVIDSMQASLKDVAMSGPGSPMSPFVVCRVGSTTLQEGVFGCGRSGPMNAFLDTGRSLIEKHSDKVHLFGNDQVGIHVGSAWLRDSGVSAMELESCCLRMKRGGFVPSRMELSIIKDHFPKFHEAYRLSNV